MTTIEQILKWPVGQKGGQWDFTVKTPKKMTNHNLIWYQDAILTDGKDEIYAKLKLGANIPIQSNWRIHVIVGERTTYNIRNKDVDAIYIDQWDTIAMTPDELEYERELEDKEWDIKAKKTIRSKCRFGILKALLNSKQVTIEDELEAMRQDKPNATTQDVIDGWIDWIMKDL